LTVWSCGFDPHLRHHLESTIEVLWVGNIRFRAVENGALPGAVASRELPHGRPFFPNRSIERSPARSIRRRSQTSPFTPEAGRELRPGKPGFPQRSFERSLSRRSCGAAEPDPDSDPSRKPRIRAESACVGEVEDPSRRLVAALLVLPGRCRRQSPKCEAASSNRVSFSP